jgi:hypothetical protein
MTWNGDLSAIKYYLSTPWGTGLNGIDPETANIDKTSLKFQHKLEIFPTICRLFIVIMHLLERSKKVAVQNYIQKLWNESIFETYIGIPQEIRNSDIQLFCELYT